MFFKGVRVIPLCPDSLHLSFVTLHTFGSLNYPFLHMSIRDFFLYVKVCRTWFLNQNLSKYRACRQVLLISGQLIWMVFTGITSCHSICGSTTQKKDTFTYAWNFCRMLVLPYHNRELIMVRASPPTAVKSSTTTLFFYEV